jgi:hypothetical protein
LAGAKNELGDKKMNKNRKKKKRFGHLFLLMLLLGHFFVARANDGGPSNEAIEFIRHCDAYFARLLRELPEDLSLDRFKTCETLLEKLRLIIAKQSNHSLNTTYTELTKKILALAIDTRTNYLNKKIDEVSNNSMRRLGTVLQEFLTDVCKNDLSTIPLPEERLMLLTAFLQEVTAQLSLLTSLDKKS